ncbi:MAG: hypothetical protein EON92_20215, partial [Burkholderiales bacterium]
MIEQIRRSALVRHMPEWVLRLLSRCYNAVFLSPNGAILSGPTPSPVQVEDMREIEAVVTRIYHLALERPPGAEERQQWINEVLSHRMSVAGMVEAIAGSPEADLVRQRAKAVPEVSNGGFDVREIEAVVTRTY